MSSLPAPDWSTFGLECGLYSSSVEVSKSDLESSLRRSEPLRTLPPWYNPSIAMKYGIGFFRFAGILYRRFRGMARFKRLQQCLYPSNGSSYVIPFMRRSAALHGGQQDPSDGFDGLFSVIDDRNITLTRLGHGLAFPQPSSQHLFPVSQPKVLFLQHCNSNAGTRPRICRPN
jgi:hypothetical protein